MQVTDVALLEKYLFLQCMLVTHGIISWLKRLAGNNESCLIVRLY